MTIVVLMSIDFDPLGVVRIHALPSSSLDDHVSRASRVATLDGGASITPYGFSDADRTFSVAMRPNPGMIAAIKRMMRLYLQVRIATDDGVFRGAIGSLDVTPQEATVQLLILEREA